MRTKLQLSRSTNVSITQNTNKQAEKSKRFEVIN